MKFILIFCIFFIKCFSQNLDIEEPSSDQQIDSPSKEVVVQHPVTISVGNPTAMTTQPPVAPLKTRVVVVHNNMVPVPIECFQPPDSGTCSKDLARIYYDHETRTCKPFSYTGCGGNANRFQSIKNCYRICHPYRYKIRPKIAQKSNQRMKVRVVPPQQRTLANQQVHSRSQQAQAAAAHARAIYAGGRGRALSPSGYMNYAPAHGRALPPSGPLIVASGGRGRKLTPLTQKHLVLTENGPQVKSQEIGTGSDVPSNTGQINR